VDNKQVLLLQWSSSLGEWGEEETLSNLNLSYTMQKTEKMKFTIIVVLLSYRSWAQVINDQGIFIIRQDIDETSPFRSESASPVRAATSLVAQSKSFQPEQLKVKGEMRSHRAGLRSINSRQLKGSKSGKGGPYPYQQECDMLEIFIYRKDIAQTRSLFGNGMGFSYQVAFYLRSDPKQAKGSFYKSMIFLQKDSMGTIFLSLNKNTGLSFTQVVGQK